MCEKTSDQVIDEASRDLHDLLKLELPESAARQLRHIASKIESYNQGVDVLCEYGDRCELGELCGGDQYDKLPW